MNKTKIKKDDTIGIIGALEQEIIYLYKNIQHLKTKKLYNYILCTGKLNKINIVLIKSGIGKVSASIASAILLHFYKIDLIINIGTAGSLQTKLIPGSIIFPHSTCYYDVNLTTFGYSLGQIPNFPKLFLANNYMMQLAEKYTLQSRMNHKKNLIISGDLFINKKTFQNTLKKKFPTAIAVDMESTAIAQACYQFKKPFLIIKYISDFSDERASLNFKKFVNLASKKLLNVIQHLLDSLCKTT
ncbi:MAG: 5'-methylthioadenosine/adenosylhomocysteine nucleosidase [Buchnera aphidicola (Meitanaphis elongallis)]